MTTVLMECLLHRQGGTIVEIDDVTYHFKPDLDGKHVCLVARDDHIERFMAIPEGYRALARVAEPVAPTTEALGAVSPPVDTAPGPVTTETETQADTTTETTTETGTAAPASDADDLEAADDAALRVIFEAEIGRKPSPRAGRDSMIDQIRAKRAG
jgi:hypothetical protein